MDFFVKYFRGLKKYIAVIIVSIILGWIAYNYTYRVLGDMARNALEEMAQQGAKAVENDINWRLTSLRSISQTADIINEKASAQEKLELIKKTFNFPNDPEIALISPDGVYESHSGERLDVSGEPFFIKAMRGESSVTLVQNLSTKDQRGIVFSVPYPNGETVEGVLCAVYTHEFLNVMVENIRFSDNGYAYILDAAGNTIAHKDRSLVLAGNETSRGPETDASMQALMGLEEQMMRGESDSGEYLFKGQKKFMGFTKVGELPWSIAVTSPKDDLFNQTHPLLVFMIIFIVIFGGVLVGAQIFFVFLRKRIKREEQSFKKAVETANIIIISFLEDGLILSFNRNAEEWLGYKREQVVKTLTIFDLLSLKDQQKLKKILEAASQGVKDKNFELTIRTRNGGAEHVVFSLNIIDQNESAVIYEMMGIDITPRVKSEIALMEKHEELSAVYEELAASEEELKEQLNELIHQKIMLQEKDERHNLVVEACNIGIWDWDMTTNTHFYSDKWYEIFEIKREECCGREDEFLTRMILPEDQDIPAAAYNHHIRNHTPFYECEYRVKTSSGQIKWIYAVGKVLWEGNGKPIKMAGAYTDNSVKKEIEEKVNRLAYYDTLTGLPNRSRLIEIFNNKKNDHVSNMALIYIDLDNFKIINDSYGHAIGDSLLIDVAKRLEKICTQNIYISRNGGDEFALLVCDYESEAAMETFVGNLVRSLEGLVRIKDYNISLSTHVGISLYPKDADNFNDLLKHADTAMYKADEQHNKYLFFDKGMNDSMVERLNLRISLKEALENKEFLLYYQPQFRSCDRRIMGFEALVRWKSPVLGMVSPMKFIPAAEESMLILPLGEWILEEALRFIKKVHQEGYSEMIMSVNISVIQLMQENFAETVIRLIEAYDLAPEFLELEITESAMMESMESVLKNIIFLKSRGIRFALDDFGTGYSSLNYLTQLPINTLKIDKSFIDNIGRIKEKAFLISSIVEIGQKLGLSIVAEGVETEDQFNYLVTRRCERIQGYLLSKPLPEQDVMKKLMEDIQQQSTIA